MLFKYLCSSEWDYPSHEDLQSCKVFVRYVSFSPLEQHFFAFNHSNVCSEIRPTQSDCSKQARRNASAESAKEAAKHNDALQHFRKGSQSMRERTTSKLVQVLARRN